MNRTETIEPTPHSTSPNEGVFVPRVDGAHPPARPPQENDPAQTAMAAAGHDSEVVLDQIRAQATDLQRQLEKQKQGLDRRESRVNSQIAEIEQERRTARLWVREQQAELARKERESRQDVVELEREVAQLRSALATAKNQSDCRESLDQQQTELDHTGKELAARSTALDLAREKLGNEQDQLGRDQAAMVARQEQFEKERRQAMDEVQAERQQAQSRLREALETSDRLRHNTEHHAQHQSAVVETATDPDHDRRKAEIERLETALSEQFSEIERERRSMELDRQRFVERTRAQRSALAERFRQQHQRLRATADRDSLRRDALDREREAVDQLHLEVSEMHRQTLEMRLVIEQLWMELSERSNPAQTTRRIGEIRRQLADQFRFARESLDEQKAQLEQLCERLGTQQSSLQQRRAELEHWFTRRQDEIEEQAARLVAREQQLDSQERYYKDLKQKWDQQRRVQQQAIRRLTVDLEQARLGVKAA